MINMKDSDIRRMAKNRVEFRDHIYVYIVVNLVLFAINLWFTPGFYWFLFVAFFWGIGLIFHFKEAYFGDSEVRIEREYQKLKATKVRK